MHVTARYFLAYRKRLNSYLAVRIPPVFGRASSGVAVSVKRHEIYACQDIIFRTFLTCSNLCQTYCFWQIGERFPMLRSENRAITVHTDSTTHIFFSWCFHLLEDDFFKNMEKIKFDFSCVCSDVWICIDDNLMGVEKTDIFSCIMWDECVWCV